MMTDSRPLSEVMATHPAPWSYDIFNGLVTMRDAAGGEVPMFTVLGVAVGISKAVAQQKKEAADTPA